VSTSVHKKQMKAEPLFDIAALKTQAEEDEVSTSVYKSSLKIKFNWETMQFDGISYEQIKFWIGLYPMLDVVDEVERKMPAWLQANAEIRKAHKSRWKQFIVNWLNREARRKA
jgi:hypothetical protein